MHRELTGDDGAAWLRPLFSDVYAISEFLRMTPQEMRQARSAGKTLSQLAEEQGVDERELVKVLVAPQEAVARQAAAYGLISETQAEWLIARTRALAPFVLSNPFIPGQDGSDVL